MVWPKKKKKMFRHLLDTLGLLMWMRRTMWRVLGCWGDWYPVKETLTWAVSKMLWKFRKSGDFWLGQQRGLQGLYRGRGIRMGPSRVSRTFPAGPRMQGGVIPDPRINFKQRCGIMEVQNQTSCLSHQSLLLPCICGLMASPSAWLPVSSYGK